jgi:hypothetical protein
MRRTTARKSYRGLGVVGWLLMVPGVIIALLLLAAGYYEGRKAYWDYRVRQMCEKDGGVTIYQKVHVSNEQIEHHVLPISGGRLSVATKAQARPDAPIFAVERTSTFRGVDPAVRRTESLIVRRSDETVVAKIVRYVRSGGDLPTGIAEGTTYICPDPREIARTMGEQLFVIEAGPK